MPGPPQPDEVLVRVLCVGFDGMDRERLVRQTGDAAYSFSV
jgi:hypothetical protein